MSSRFTDAPYPDLFVGAAKVRAHRDEFMDQVTAGEVSLDDVFERAAADPVLASMKVLGTIEGQPDYAKVQTRRAFGDLGISEAAHIGHVTAEQRAQLPQALEKHKR